MAEKWIVREYREGDEGDLIALHREVFGSEADPEWWRWRYLGNSACPPIILVAVADQRIVGQYALVPVRVKMGNGECLACLSLDTMVHPDFRGAGMFTKLAEAAYAAAAGRGFRFVYGFPNANSHHGFVSKLGWTDLHDGIPLWVRPLDSKAVIGKRFGDNRVIAGLGSCAVRAAMGVFKRPRKATGTCTLRELQSLDERFDALWEEVSVRYPIALIRDRAYLDWRYAHRPNMRYTILAAERDGRLLGYTIPRVMPKFGLRIGFIMELIVSPGDRQVSRDLLRGTFDRFEAEGADIAGCLMPPRHGDARLLQEMGWIRVPKCFLPQDMFWGVRPLQAADAYLTDPANWYISWGDHDSV